MNIKKTTQIFAVAIVLLLLGSACVKEVDFDQAKDVVLQPVYELDFIYSRVRAINFSNINTGEFVPTLRDTLQDEFFSGEVNDKLLAAELHISFENSIARNFDSHLQFLDANNAVLLDIPLNAVAGSVANPILTIHNISIDKATLDVLSTATKLATEIIIDNGATDLEGILHLKSRAIYYTSL